MAPQYDYWEHVFWPTLQKGFGIPSRHVQPTVVRRGYFPRGGGQVDVRVEPVLGKHLAPISLTDRGQVSDLYIRSFHAGKVPRHVADDMARVAKKSLRKICPDVFPEVEVVTESNVEGNASGILLVAKTTTGCLLGGSALGSPKKKSHATAKEAVSELEAALNDGGCVDEWLQDQLIFFMALAHGTSTILTGSLTLHTQTAIWVAEQMSGATFDVTKVDPSVAAAAAAKDDDVEKSSKQEAYGSNGRIEGKHLIRCKGISFLNQSR